MAFEFVAAKPEDHAEFARFFAELGIPDPVPTPEQWSRGMALGTFFLVEGERKVGYAWLQRFHPRGYVRHVVVAPEARGRGIGSELMRAIAAELRSKDCERWELNVKRDNARAIGLYERFGMRYRYDAHVVRIPWACVGALPSRPIDVLEVEPWHEIAIERAFDLPSGQIRSLVRNERRVQVAVLENDAFAGFASFDPDFPGAAPFRARDAEIAHALLEACRPHALPEHERLQIFLEDSPVAAQALVEAGAQMLFDVMHLDGAIPCA